VKIVASIKKSSPEVREQKPIQAHFDHSHDDMHYPRLGDTSEGAIKTSQELSIEDRLFWKDTQVQEKWDNLAQETAQKGEEEHKKFDHQFLIDFKT
jgi:hypothetical protein